MSLKKKIEAFDPNGVGLKNGRFIGLPFDADEARIILLPVPWDVTVSYGEGTSGGPQNILDASSQLDLMDPYIPDAWKMGIHMEPVDPDLVDSNQQLREMARAYIAFIEAGGQAGRNDDQQTMLEAINEGCQNFNKWVYKKTSRLLEAGKLVGLIGGDHSSPLGYLRALAERYKGFGILQIDAHMDLREAYEGFQFSHASIFRNAAASKKIKRIVQVGIRDYCQEEIDFARSSDKLAVFFDRDLKTDLFRGKSWDKICKNIIKQLPSEVYISFDIDGLTPSLCPNTGTPVPGGLNIEQVQHLFFRLVESGRRIIGFDLCEVAGQGHEWDGNVGARVAYSLSNWMGYSQGLTP